MKEGKSLSTRLHLTLAHPENLMTAPETCWGGGSEGEGPQEMLPGSDKVLPHGFVTTYTHVTMNKVPFPLSTK